MFLIVLANIPGGGILPIMATYDCFILIYYALSEKKNGKKTSRFLTYLFLRRYTRGVPFLKKWYIKG